MNFPELSLPVLAAIFFRALGFLSVLPIGEGVTAVFHRTALAFGLALLCGWGVADGGNLNWSLLVYEFLIGVVIVLPLALLVSMAEGFGELLDTVRGQSISSFFDANSGTQSSVSGGLFKYGLWAMVTTLGALNSSVIGFSQSLTVIPIGQATLIDLSGLSILILQVCGTMLTGLFVVIAPFAFAFLLIDFAIGIIAKMKPGFQLSQEAFVVKTFVCFFMLIAALDIAPFDILVRLAAPIVELPLKEPIPIGQ